MGEKSLMKTTDQIATKLETIIYILSTFMQIFPTFIRNYLNSLLPRLIAYFRSEVSITFHQHKSCGRRSRAYAAIKSYLASISSNNTSQANRLRGGTSDNHNKIWDSLVFTVDDHEVIVDEFEQLHFEWLVSKSRNKMKMTSDYSRSTVEIENHYFTLRYHSKYRELVMGRYLKHVMDEGEDIENRRRTRVLYTNNASSEWKDFKRGLWSRIVFDHPSTFNNLALDTAKNEEIIEDLIVFSKSRDFYNRIGKAWKRGYLLYGPPGTGKSTMIACMANLLSYDVYDLELTMINSNAELRTLLISIGEKAIVVIEDIDCSLSITWKRGEDKKSSKLEDPDSELDTSESKTETTVKGSSSGTIAAAGSSKKSSSKVTLSGLLNIIDGLWSPCGGERIIVFTTNHFDKLDPALIRTGRMDKHIELSYCTFEAFKVLARNYLSIESHPLFERIEKLLKEAKVTPSDLVECLLPKSRNLDVEHRLEILIQAIEMAKEGNQKSRSK